MPGLKLYTGNRLETLSQQLLQVLESPLPSPLATEVVVVQSKGMERWLSLELASCKGVCANFRFPFPNAIVKEFFNLVLEGDDASGCELYEREVMAFRLMELLPKWQHEEVFAPLQQYLKGREDGDERRLFQLCRTLADLFDQYTLYRPEMLLQWERNEGSEARGWQAELWRRYGQDVALLQSPGGEPAHRAALCERFLQKVGQGGFDTQKLPERLSVFGISFLPPFHLQALAEMARYIDIHLFLLNPCAESWDHIVPDRDYAYYRKRSGERYSAEELYLESGNTLLASMGEHGRDFHRLILENLDCEETACFEEPGGDNLLSVLQSDILHLRQRKGVVGTECADRLKLAPGDTSLQIHCCHSPMREVEALYDRLLDLFETTPDLDPRDVVVMTPEIDLYAPYISAVFGSVQDSSRKIPFTIADRNPSSENPFGQLLFQLMDLVDSSFGATQILDLMENALVQKRFDLAPEELERVRYWVGQVRIRWGIDAAHRERLGETAFEENSWRTGLDRLLLGYAMGTDADSLIEGVLPFGDVEGSEALILGRFSELAESLFQLIPAMEHPRTLSQWAEFLSGVLERFALADRDTEKDFYTIRQQLAALKELQKQAFFDSPVELDVLRSFLTDKLNQAGGAMRFLSGGVTFCAMLPMRSVPFRVVALLGMNDGAFPRLDRPLGFDLIAKNKRLGDPSRRSEDRYLFLEALLSARDCLLMTYVGQSVRDNSEIPPSVLVSELLDAVECGFYVEDGDILDHIVIHHRLQAYHRAYFDSSSTLFSYSLENFHGALAQQQDQLPLESPFLDRSMDPPDEGSQQVALDDLVRFLSNPSRFWVRERLAMVLPSPEEEPEDCESFRMQGLERFQVEQELLECRLSGGNTGHLLEKSRAAGLLPPAVLGDEAFRQAESQVAELADHLRPLLQAEVLEPLSFELSLGPFRLYGSLGPLRETGLLRYRAGRLRAKDLLQGWVEHLVLACMDPPGVSAESLMAGRDESFKLSSVEKAQELLGNLLQYYWQGLTEPLPLLPEASLAFVRQWEKKEDLDSALDEARKKWQGSPFSGPGEGEDPYMALCFGQVDPFDETFVRVARDIYGPLLSSLTRWTP